MLSKMTYLGSILLFSIFGLCTFVGQTSVTEKDGKLEFPKYEKSRRKIDEIVKKLASFTELSPVFK